MAQIIYLFEGGIDSAGSHILPSNGIIIYLFVWKMTESISASLPRSINFQATSMRELVMGSATFTNFNKENSRIPNTSVPAGFKSLNHPPFNFYNRPNLLLSECERGDVQVLYKTPLVYQEDLAVTCAINKQHSAYPPKAKGKTTAGFYPSKEKQIEEEKSKESQMNDFLFNYRQQSQQKKQKRLNFLSEIEDRLNQLERETTQIQSGKEQQYQELHNILSIQNQMKNDAARDALVGKISMAIQESEHQPKDAVSIPLGFNDKMQFLEINAAIEDQHEYNDYLLEQVQKVSSHKRIEKQANSPAKSLGRSTGFKKYQAPQGSLSKTLKRPVGAPPRMGSTSKKLTKA